MKTKSTLNNHHIRTIFLSPNHKQINNLYAHLIKNNFTTCHIKTLQPSANTTFSYLEPKVPFYYIMVSLNEQVDAFEVGKSYAVNNDLDDIICCSPKLEFDSVKTIKDGDLGL